MVIDVMARSREDDFCVSQKMRQAKKSQIMHKISQMVLIKENQFSLQCSESYDKDQESFPVRSPGDVSECD